jgi:hypothetical protein
MVKLGGQIEFPSSRIAILLFVSYLGDMTFMLFVVTLIVSQNHNQ